MFAGGVTSLRPIITLFHAPTSGPPAYVSFCVEESGFCPSASARHLSVTLDMPLTSYAYVQTSKSLGWASGPHSTPPGLYDSRCGINTLGGVVSLASAAGVSTWLACATARLLPRVTLLSHTSVPSQYQ